MKTYSEKLKDPRWQRKRLEILQRDEFKCSCCDDADSMLSVHHRYYVSGRMPWEYPDWCFKTLCKQCHEGAHDLGLGRLEGQPVPCEDTFETTLNFLGAGDASLESDIWDLAVEISMLAQAIGRSQAIQVATNAVNQLR